MGSRKLALLPCFSFLTTHGADENTLGPSNKQLALQCGRHKRSIDGSEQRFRFGGIPLLYDGWNSVDRVAQRVSG